jgi:hypothetical protein
MIIVGLTGSIGSGKTTFADFLAGQFRHAKHYESWQLIAEVAESLRSNGAHPDPNDVNAVNAWLMPLPEAIEEICHKRVAFGDIKLDPGVVRDSAEYTKLFQYLELAQSRPELAEGPIDEARKEDLRSILQWLGGYLAAKCGGDIWYGEIIRRIQAESGLELATIGGVRFLADAQCVRQASGMIIAVDRSGWTARDKTDPTERERARIQVDSIVYNDGALTQLQACAQEVASDLKGHNLLAKYRASER